MPPLPTENPNVARDEVGDLVSAMLQNPDVGDVICKKNADGSYTVTPKRK